MTEMRTHSATRLFCTLCSRHHLHHGASGVAGNLFLQGGSVVGWSYRVHAVVGLQALLQ